MSTQTWCTCSIPPTSMIDLETLIRCDNRECTPGWYHLTCVQLPAHPPRHLGWYCPRCVKRWFVGEHRGGVTNLRGGGVEVVERWSREEREWNKGEAKGRGMNCEDGEREEGIQMEGL